MLASVIIYTYDRKEFILKAVESVLSQTLPRKDYEIIVVKAFKDPLIDDYLIKVVEHSLFVDEKAHGKKLSKAIEASSGDYIFFLDDDDQFLENKLELVVSLFKKVPELIFAHNSIIKINDAGGISNERDEAVPSQDLFYETDKLSRASVSNLLRYRANWYSSSMAFRRSVLTEKIAYIDKVYQSIDPFLFLCALDSDGKIALLRDRLTRYRIHESTTNYFAKFDEYTTSKQVFYRRTSEIVKMALEMSDGSTASAYIHSYMRHSEFMAECLNLNFTRKSTYMSLLNFIPAFRFIFTRYYFIWLLFGFFKFFAGKNALKMYYWFSVGKL